MHDVLSRAVEASARAVDQFDGGDWSATPSEYQSHYISAAEAAIRAALPAIAEDLEKVLFGFGDHGDDAVLALRARLSEIMGD